MFATLSRFRRQIAVLTALAMVASVLVAVPAVAADPIEPDYAASFSACVGAATEDSSFEDVPAAHANAGDINCIAYYGITKGTSATTYSPLMSVTREHMALFLTRLAGRMGIAVNDDPADAGFTDIGDLSDKSQTAINQLADLEITRGTSATTYSPSNSVTRGQMAQFIARLMNHITPMADGALGLSTTTQYGYTPADVENNRNLKDAPIGTPFTDLGTATKDQYDSITNLYELGVVSGVSATSYAPGAPITRAAMAEFMAAAMGHSNARPAGLSIQATPSVTWGDHDPTVVASMRDDSFMAVEDQAVDIFSSIAGDDALRDDGTCNFGTNPDDVLGGDFVTGNCVWNDNDDATDVDGNLITSETVAAGTTRVFYAWIGNSDGDKFDSDKFTAQTASSSARHAHDGVRISDTINAHAEPTTEGDKVNLNSTRTVTFTVQLTNDPAGDVARPGVQFRVEYRQGPETADEPRDTRTYVNTHEDLLTTDDDGKVTFTITGPTPNPDVSGQARNDDLVFSELHPVTGAVVRTVTEDVAWSEEVLVLRKTTLEVPTYVLAGNPSIGAVVRLWDQYGNSHRSRRGQDVDITIGEAATGNTNVGTDRPVISRGYARWARSMPTISAGTAIAVSYDGLVAYSRDANGYLLQSDGTQIDSDDAATGTQPTTNHIASVADDGTVTLLTGLVEVYTISTIIPANADLAHEDTPGSVEVVNRANSTHTAAYTVTHVMADDNQYLADTDTATTNTDVLFTYDSDDTFIDSRVSEGKPISMEKFEELIDNNATGVANDVTSGAQVQVEAVIYNIDGVSVFRITSTTAG
jgi:hypothetical protein